MFSYLSRILALIISLSVISTSYAVTYPTAPNPGGAEVTGGYFNTYFTNMFTTDCGAGLFVYGFDNLGNKNCGSIPTQAVSNATLSLSGSLVGTPNYVAKYTPTGTGINNSQIYDNGANVGVGTATPGARLEVAGQVKITGGIPGLGKVLTSDATGLATWLANSSATATGITGGAENYISKFGTG